MAASQVARFVGNDPDDLVWRFRLQQSARVDENTPPGNERVEALIVDEDDLNPGFGEACGLEDRACIVTHQCLDLGVANDRHALRIGRQAGSQRHRGADQSDSGVAGEAAKTVRFENVFISVSVVSERQFGEKAAFRIS